MSSHNGPRGDTKISCASVIPEALPRLQDVIFGSTSQRGEIGEAAEPLIVIGNDCGHLSLLKHELGDENGVGVVRLAPWEIAAVTAKPAQE